MHFPQHQKEARCHACLHYSPHYSPQGSRNQGRTTTRFNLLENCNLLIQHLKLNALLDLIEDEETLQKEQAVLDEQT